MKALLNTGSTIYEGQFAKGGEKYSEGYMKECALCWISPLDFEEMGCPEKVKVTSMDGKHTVAVYTRCTDRVMCGNIFMPRAIWSNVVIDPNTFSTGSPLYKGSPVDIEPTDEEVLTAEDIVLKVYAGGK